MCGACGSGTVRAPWEVAAHGAGPRPLAARAAEAQALLGRPWRVSAFGPAGYTVHAPTGSVTVHRDLDGLLEALLAAASDGVRRRAVQTADGSFVARALLARDG